MKPRIWWSWVRRAWACGIHHAGKKLGATKEQAYARWLDCARGGR